MDQRDGATPKVEPHEITVQDYRRPIRHIVVNLEDGKVLRTHRRESIRICGLGKKQRGKTVFVYKTSDGSSEQLVAQRGRTKIDLTQPGCTATVTRSFLGLRSTVRITCGKKSLTATQWNIEARVMSVIDITWDGLDEDGEDFVGWIKGVVDDPDLRVIKTWMAIDQLD